MHTAQAAPIAPPDQSPRRPRLSAAIVGTPSTIPYLRSLLSLIPDGPRATVCIIAAAPEPEPHPRLDLADTIVLESPEALADLPNRPDLAIVSLPASMPGAIAQTRAALRRHGIAERFIPPLAELLDAAPPYAVGATGPGPAWTAPRIDIADIIGRSPHSIDRVSVARILGGRRILITGAGGSIGSELARIAATFSPERLILVERSENALFEIDRQLAERHPSCPRRALLHDVVEPDSTLGHLLHYRPHVVFHAAAHKHVPLMEDHPSHAVTNNLFGTKSIADAAAAAGAERFVFISTDKAVNPTSVMGATKRLAELYIQGLAASRPPAAPGTAFSIVRFGNVLGSAASVLQIWSAQLAEGGPITVTDPRMSRYFMTIPEAAALVIQAAAIDPPPGAAPVYVLDMGRPVRILDLAERFIRAHGFAPRLPGRPAPTDRPAVDVIFSGIRPGEKLAEELAYRAESLQPTRFSGINAWTGSALPLAATEAMIADLSPIRPEIQGPPRSEILAAIRRHVPEMAAAA